MMRQANLPLPSSAAQVEVKPGDIFAFGRHRIMCGDATDKESVARLFNGRKPTLVVTSPPYAKQRDYDRPIACWDSMMINALTKHAFDDHVQMLINLGPYHKNNALVLYWNEWLSCMTRQGWKLYSQYIWNKMRPVAGNFHGRLPPSHEFVFHLNKAIVLANKWQKCAHAGKHQKNGRVGIRDKKGKPRKRASMPVGSHKVPGSVISTFPVSRAEAVGVPAQMPLSLASFLIRTWKSEDCVTYDPFGGSGTTLLACEQENVDGVAIDIAPAYVKIALARWRKAHPTQRIERL